MNSNIHLLQTLIFSVTLGIAMSSCDHLQSDIARINLHARGHQQDSVEIVIFNLLDFSKSKIASGVLDSKGEVEIIIEMSNPLFASIKIAGNMLPVYLSPNFQLDISFDLANFYNSAEFEGKGAAANILRRKILAIQPKYAMAGGTFFAKLTPEQFNNRMDSMAWELSKVKLANEAGDEVGSTDAALIFAEGNLKVINTRQNYNLMNYRGRLGEIPESLMVETKDIPMQAEFLRTSMLEFSSMIHMYLDSEITGPVWEKLSEQSDERLADRVPLAAHRKIMSLNFSSEIEEYVAAKHLAGLLVSGKYFPEVDSIYRDFEMHWPESEYLPRIKEHFDELLLLATGSSLPEVIGVDLIGKAVKLSSLKGKILYLDFWATWCGPCIKEFPQSKEIRAKFEGNNSVEFVYISVDSNKDKWREYMKSDPQFGGVHMVADQKDVFEAYKIAAIPRYVLIDKNGDVISINAPRPSSGEVTNLIEQHIQ